MVVRDPADENFKLSKKERNGILYGIFWSLSLYLVEVFRRNKVSPNQVSLLSFFSYVFSGVFFYFGHYLTGVTGAFLFTFAVLLDCTDGKLARVTDKTSNMGIWLDYNFDYIKYLFVYIPLTLALFRQTGDVRIFVCGFVIVTTILTYVIITQRFGEFPFAQESTAKITGSRLHRIARQLYAYEMIEAVLLILFSVMGRLEWFLVIWAVYFSFYYLATAVVLGHAVRRNDKKEDATKESLNE